MVAILVRFAEFSKIESQRKKTITPFALKWYRFIKKIFRREAKYISWKKESVRPFSISRFQK